MEVVTKQKCHERLYLLRPRRAEVESWYYILVPYDKISIIKDFERGNKVSAKNYYRFIEYRDEHGATKRLSGPGTDPPAHVVQWVYDNYGKDLLSLVFRGSVLHLFIIRWCLRKNISLDSAALDETITLIYTADDIRLCTMQQSSTLQSVGVIISYHKHEKFNYVKPIDNFQNTLAFRAGIRLYDRVIEVDGTNIENDVDGKMIKQITNQTQLIQLLLCSPATYEHYRTENKQLHSNLETVKLMRPVRNNESKKIFSTCHF
jgi:hypothetical protein